MKHLKIISINTFIAFFLITISHSVSAQYTLTDDDVTVANGIIESCSYDFTIKDIIIPEMLDEQTVTGIGNSVFKENGITNVKLPKSLTFIDAFAFRLNDIVSLDLSNSNLKNIGSSSFEANDISDLDLSGCYALATIEQWAFSSNSITSINLNNCTSLTNIERGAFTQNYIKNLDLSTCQALNTIGYHAFYTNSLTSLDLSHCPALTTIEMEAFAWNKLSEVIFSPSITKIYPAAFNNNNISFINDIPSDGIIYSRNADASIDSTTIVSYGSSSDVVTIPHQVVTIKSHAFSKNLITNLDLSACKHLTIIEDYAFYYNDLMSLDLGLCTKLTTIGHNSFAKNKLTEIIFPSSITDIYSEAFNNNKISSINGTPSDGIIYSRNEDASIDSTTIVSYGGSSDAVTIPHQVVTIEELAFEFCYLTSINFSTCTALTTIGNSAFDRNYNLTDLDLSACTALTSIGYSAFDNSKIAEFTLPTPSITGYKFNNWFDGKGNVYSGGSLVNNLSTHYSANVTITSISDIPNYEINIYPNPTSNILSIVQPADYSIKSIEIFNRNGQKLKTPEIMDYKETVTLNFEKYVSGMYLLRITTSNNNYYSKIIVKE